MKRIMLDGNGAASETMRLARIGVVSAYPITPQSPIAEVLSDFVQAAKVDLDVRYVGLPNFQLIFDHFSHSIFL